jgi:uncharacterized membrane-anchored protein
MALALPILGVGGLVVRSELALRGHDWRLPIHGYDPRDLLRGHYLTFQIDTDNNSCWNCCLCLRRDGAAQHATRVNCDLAVPCAVRLSHEQEREMSRFYVPEGEAEKLQDAVRAGHAEMVFVERQGQLSIKQLLIDGQPWQGSAE